MCGALRGTMGAAEGGMGQNDDRRRGADKPDQDPRSPTERRIALELEIQHLKARVTALQDDIAQLERDLEG
jgi:hypothetical protein